MQKDELRPIDTEYKGYLFRSRLEARWAIFFDLLGIEWTYELQGFKVRENDGYYLPDFYLKTFNCYFEVKRDSIEGKQWDDALRRCKAMVTTVGHAIIIVRGDPVNYEAKLFAYPAAAEHFSQIRGEYHIRSEKSGQCVDCLIALDPSYVGRMPAIFCLTSGTYDFYSNKKCEHKIYAFTNNGYSGTYDEWRYEQRTKDAALKARQARFEHGEKPKSVEVPFM